mmetsp:Transcript_45907/g.123033  ORF Transcript_45907/g.123033 Transcript_45907/m.123033 type:complete len:217 (+) Transcript_45907:154-804(+)
MRNKAVDQPFSRSPWQCKPQAREYPTRTSPSTSDIGNTATAATRKLLGSGHARHKEARSHPIVYVTKSLASNKSWAACAHSTSGAHPAAASRPGGAAWAADTSASSSRMTLAWNPTAASGPNKFKRTAAEVASLTVQCTSACSMTPRGKPIKPPANPKIVAMWPALGNFGGRPSNNKEGNQYASTRLRAVPCCVDARQATALATRWACNRASKASQ